LVNNYFTVNSFFSYGNNPHDFWLKAENPEFPDIYPRENEQVKVWGIITCILKKLK